MIEALSRNVVLPIAGIILTFIACYELIEMITQHNNMAQFEPALIMRWIFKTAVSVWLISNTFDIVMAVFDITQKVVSDSSSIIAGIGHPCQRHWIIHAAIQPYADGRWPPVRAVPAKFLHRHHHADLEHRDFRHRLRAHD